jgi:hypothetical protein
LMVLDTVGVSRPSSPSPNQSIKSLRFITRYWVKR